MVCVFSFWDLVVTLTWSSIREIDIFTDRVWQSFKNVFWWHHHLKRLIRRCVWGVQIECSLNQVALHKKCFDYDSQGVPFRSSGTWLGEYGKQLWHQPPTTTIIRSNDAPKSQYSNFYLAAWILTSLEERTTNRTKKPRLLSNSKSGYINHLLVLCDIDI